jgi:hypothetical protein
MGHAHEGRSAINFGMKSRFACDLPQNLVGKNSLLFVLLHPSNIYLPL